MTDLLGARCIGATDLFEATIATHGMSTTTDELKQARTDALNLCAACPALDPCRAWLDQQRPTQRPRGVVAGRLVRSDGRIRPPQTQGG